MVPGEDYDLFIMPNINPAMTDKVCIVETGALAIASQGQQIDAAKQMAAWWVTPEAQTAWSNNLGDAPANPKATSDNPVLNNLLGTFSSESYTLYQRYWEASPVPIVEGAVDFLAEFMLNPGDLESVLEQHPGAGRHGVGAADSVADDRLRPPPRPLPRPRGRDFRPSPDAGCRLQRSEARGKAAGRSEPLPRGRGKGP